MDTLGDTCHIQQIACPIVQIHAHIKCTPPRKLTQRKLVERRPFKTHCSAAQGKLGKNGIAYQHPRCFRINCETFGVEQVALEASAVLQRYVELTAFAREEIPRKTAVVNNQLHFATVLDVDQVTVPGDQLSAISNRYFSNATEHVIASDSNRRVRKANYLRVINDDRVRTQFRVAATGDLSCGGRDQPDAIALYEAIILDRDLGTGGVDSRSLAICAHCGIHSRTLKSDGAGTYLNASPQPSYLTTEKLRLGLSAAKPLQPNSWSGRAADYRTSSINPPPGKHDRRFREGIIQGMPYRTSIYIKHPSQTWAGDLIYLSTGRQVQGCSGPGQHIIQTSVVIHILNLTGRDDNRKSGFGSLVFCRHLTCQRHTQYDGGGLPIRRSDRPLTSTLNHDRHLNHKKERSQCSTHTNQVQAKLFFLPRNF
ncbi:MULTISPECIES: hypothetical protein [unclassified Pseudomonas]|uniref:hypothetical protein n=1 Tax=unclassified Pseudomonas TaxID=196821 RepID=UPI001FD0D6FA|nr:MULTISPECIES: hypothetical protein [unclassified Pseudomonas]